MMFMQFQIGFDMGIVLIKSILFSMLSVFTLMPGLLMLFSKARRGPATAASSPGSTAGADLS